MGFASLNLIRKSKNDKITMEGSAACVHWIINNKFLTKK